ncbi:MAG: hypothetical protein HUJ16_10465 [Kangiella sp.]|nr:hypothetical protein [Kangiella sp.]
MAIIRSNTLPVKHPGIVFKEKCMGSENLIDVSKKLSMNRKELLSFTEGKSPVTIELAKGLEQMTGISLEYWMNRQKKYDEHINSDLK